MVNTSKYRGELIKEAMEAQKLSIQSVADKSGITRPTMYRIFESDEKISVERLSNVAKTVGIDLEKLFEKQTV